MIAFLLPLLGKLGIPEPLRKAALYASFAILLIALLGIAKCSYDSSIITAHDDKLTAKIVKKDSAAKEQASIERANDTVAIAKAEKDRNDAIIKGPAVRPSPASIRANCQRLRNGGTDTSGIPLCN